MKTEQLNGIRKDHTSSITMKGICFKQWPGMEANVVLTNMLKNHYILFWSCHPSISLHTCLLSPCFSLDISIIPPSIPYSLFKSKQSLS